MFNREKVLYKGKTSLESYQVVDMIYEGRKARVLFSGNRDAAFSGMPLDGNHELLFDYIQRLFELVAHTRPKRLLIIGGGTYTLPIALMRALPDIRIDVAEIDPGLDKIARDFFGFSPDPRLQIFHSGGKEFLEKTKNIYDMIIVDAFTHLQIPESLTGKDLAFIAYKKLSFSGIIAINIISPYRGQASTPVKSARGMYRKIYKRAVIYPADSSISLWASQNFIMVAEKGVTHGSHGLRFEALDNTT